MTQMTRAEAILLIKEFRRQAAELGLNSRRGRIETMIAQIAQVALRAAEIAVARPRRWTVEELWAEAQREIEEEE